MALSSMIGAWISYPEMMKNVHLLKGVEIYDISIEQYDEEKIEYYFLFPKNLKGEYDKMMPHAKPMYKN